MNPDDRSIEPSTNLSLALGYSNQCIQRSLNNDPGAGANAASEVDMTFIATNPLSELVWSPHKGLSLRCADGGFSYKNSSLSRDVEHSSMPSASTSDLPKSNAAKPPSNETCIASLATCNLVSEVSGRDNSTAFSARSAGFVPMSESGLELKTATGDQAEEPKNARDMNVVHKDDSGYTKGEAEAKLELSQNYPTCEESFVRATDVGDGNHALLGVEIVLASEVNNLKECQAYDTKKIQNATSSGKQNEESPFMREEVRKNKIVTSPHDIFPMDKLESTAENDLETPFGRNKFAVANSTLALKSADDIENNTQHYDDLLPIDKALAVQQDPTNSRLQNNQTEGKSKALSDGDANEKMLNQKDGSHESVESCNSDGPFSTGKRQWNFDQRFTVGSKRVKTKIQDSPGSSLIVKKDSSFVNWISNMTRGFLKSWKGEEPSLSPALVDLNHEHESHDQDTFTCIRKEDPTYRTKGLQSNFQSLYCQEAKGQEAVTLNADHETKESELDDRIYDLNATPIACRTVTGNVYKWFLPSIKSFDGSLSGNQAGVAPHSRRISSNFPATEENGRSISTEKINSCGLTPGEEKDGTSFNSSLVKHKTNGAGNNSDFPLEEKTTHNFAHNGESLDSLWIARFTPKTSGSLLKQCPNKSSDEVFDCSADGMKLKPQLQNLLCYSSELENVKANKRSTEELLFVQYCGTANEASFGFCEAEGHRDDINSTYKPKPILTPRVKTSEEMVSVFARRLEALKHITPSNNSDASACVNMICFFCGIKGHHLRECPDVADTELDDLLRKIKLIESIKELPCVCVRCFQLNHWAVSCPRLRNQADNDAYLISQSGPGKMQLDVRSEDDKKLKDITAIAPTVCCRNDSGIEKDLNNWKSNETDTSEKRKSNINLLRKEVATTTRENGLKENQVTPLYGFISSLISDVPKGILDIVRSLRLTRTNILRWINSNVPLSPLDGYFVRLRLGKWEEGLGGTGYYVARITGMQTERSSKNSKKSIAVNVGGIKCLVESRSVSNHDFLEDELRTWWSAASRGGDGKLPSKEELRLKVKEKKTLGF